MKWPLVLIYILGYTTASPIDNQNVKWIFLNGGITRNSVIEGQLQGLLEVLRNTMLTGSDDIPILDPLKVDHLALDDSDVPVPGLRVEVGDATVTKLSSFVVDELTVQRTTLLPLRYRLNLDLAIPVLEVEADHYDLFVLVDGATVFGKGDAKINIIEPRISGHIIARPTLGFGALYIRLEQCQLKFTLKAFVSQIKGLLGGGPAVDDFVNAFLRFLVPDLVELYEDEIAEALSSIVLEVGNEFLADFNLFGIIGS